MSSESASCGKPPIISNKSRRTTKLVPTQNAQSTASFAGWNVSKKTRWSSTKLSRKAKIVLDRITIIVELWCLNHHQSSGLRTGQLRALENDAAERSRRRVPICRAHLAVLRPSAVGRCLSCRPLHEVVRPSNILRTDFGAVAPHLITSGIVADEDHRRWIVQSQGRDDRLFQNV